MRLILVTCLILLTLPAVAGAQTGAPIATTGTAEAVGRTSATLNGTVDPNLTPTTYHFEYGTTTDYGLESPTQSAGSGADPVPVQATISGLSVEAPASSS